MMTILKTNLPNLLHRGKIRDTYDLGEGLLLMVATDRISAFDGVLPNGVPDKGILLARMSAFWFQKTAHIVPNHFLGLASDLVDEFPKLATIPKDLAQRAMVVKRAQRIDIECIVRGYVAGSAWAEYTANGSIFGRPENPGMQEGQRLPTPFFTPTTKADEGHDENMSIEEVVNMVGPERAQELEQRSIEVYSYAHQYAEERGIIIADTKMEFGLIDGKLILIDELLTPDSSRFWEASGYSPGHSQPNYDKQFVRDWLVDSGWNREPPAPKLPDDIVEKTGLRYREAYRRLTGHEYS
ncbi:MAG: phosphoribosylaminoimidazolesuccinocarboxamide synthase [SAR202 cluster bacterium Io17-Chloro-G3]|nr:MAG: phosphoribosylaminoimidazolesuccinocarboxamide synthase [SAR202 cluster bacterium Io17-Chloro-G3]